MALTKQQAKENLKKLIEKFNKESDLGHIKEYNEEATKTAFIQPLLKDVLGWDVNDRNEVSPEEKISRGRVDYGLKIEGKTKIFVEAKPPKADLDKHIEQAVKYGYNRKGVPFVLLTDFEGIKLFDVTVKPDSRNPKKGLKLNLFYYRYELDFDKLWLLSKESVINGELDKLLLEKPKDRIPVDKAILDDLKEWREDLAKDIYKNNLHLFINTTEAQRHRVTQSKTGEIEKSNLQNDSVTSETLCLRGEPFRDAEYLKEITQRILDRIIFMRSCEDRGLIHRTPLKVFFEEHTDTLGTNTMVFLKEEFKHYNIIFDSDLFSPKDWEKDLQIDFRVMNKIVMDTYNPYQFDVIPLEVLGNIYEQYLGYTIRLTPQQVKYELKPEVRKAGGVYYTPEYIVDYIVKNTVGKILKEGATPKKLRILDPACGSSSFLIRAYEEMLNYYKEQKKKQKPRMNTDKNVRNCHPELDSDSTQNRNSEIPNQVRNDNNNVEQRQLDLKHEDTEIRLTIHEKAEILKNHIFGVDIDEQAVEVTKLSLMLKMLEGEFGIIPGRNILPMLDKNIRCGNSLISGSPLELKKYFGDDYYKVKPFNWEEEFKDIFKDGGFDVVIGNPPYGAELSNIQRKYLEDYYKLHSTDTACLFMALATELLKDNGVNSFIIPKPFTYSSNWENIREKLFNGLIEIVDCSKVWKEVKLEQVIYLFKKNKKSNTYRSCVRKNQGIEYLGDIDKKTFREFGFYLNGISHKELLIGNKIRNVGTFLNDYVINQRGAIYQKYISEKPSDYKVLGGKQIGRYFISENVKGYIPKNIIDDEKAHIKENSILVQRIIAHIEKPIDHIKIIASLSRT